MKTERLAHLELLRLLAIAAVLFNHTGEYGFFHFSLVRDSWQYWPDLFLSVACKYGAPLFFMISGALLLNREESIGAIFRRRVLRMVLVLAAVSFCYQAYDAGLGSFGVGSFLARLYGSRMSAALWFLYAYIGLLLMLPLLRRLARGMTPREYAYLAAMSLLFTGVLPILQYRLGMDRVVLNRDLQVPLFTCAAIVFFLMGHCFEHVLPEKWHTWRNAFLLGVLSLVCIAVCCHMTDYRAMATGRCEEGVSQVFHSSLIAVPTYAIYFAGKLLFMKRDVPRLLRKAVCLLGSTAFGIFLMERFLRENTRDIFIALEPAIGTIPACLLWVLAMIAIGTGITFVLKKIPLAGKYI